LSGDPEHRLANHASFAFRNVSGNDLLIHLDVNGIAASSGSACLVGDPKPSSVLESLGFSEEWSRGGLRLTVGRQNSAAEMDCVIKILPEIVHKLQHLKSNFT
jgi:cysteine desulfurase